jgi:hypothetical protein
MILRPTHCRVIMPAAITGRDATARYSAVRGPTAVWRAMAQGGPHQEAMAISFSDLDYSLQKSPSVQNFSPFLDSGHARGLAVATEPALEKRCVAEAR